MNQAYQSRAQRLTQPDRRRPEAQATYLRRWVLALGAAALVMVFGGKFAVAEYHAITGTTLADRLAEPFDQAQTQFNQGDFSGAKEVNLPNVNQSAYQDALALAGQGAAESAIDEVMNDIEYQQGDTPGAGDPVIVPAADLRPGLQK